MKQKPISVGYTPSTISGPRINSSVNLIDLSSSIFIPSISFGFVESSLEKLAAIEDSFAPQELKCKDEDGLLIESRLLISLDVDRGAD